MLGLPSTAVRGTLLEARVALASGDGGFPQRIPATARLWQDARNVARRHDSGAASASDERGAASSRTPLYGVVMPSQPVTRRITAAAAATQRQVGGFH